MIAKQLDIFSIGLLSRRPIFKDKAMDILGDIDEVRLLENAEMYKRFTDYLVESYG